MCHENFEYDKAIITEKKNTRSFTRGSNTNIENPFLFTENITRVHTGRFKYDIEYTGEKKTIEGIDCQKVTLRNYKSTELTMYIAEDLDIVNNVNIEYAVSGFVVQTIIKETSLSQAAK